VENPVDLAERLYAEGKTEDARALLERASTLPGLRARALSDLAVLAAGDGDRELAARLLEAALRADPYHRAAALNLFDLLESGGDPARAEPWLQRAATRLYADTEVSVRLERLEQRHAGQPRLAVICATELETFLGDVVAGLSGDFLVRSYVTRDLARMREAVEWADVVWIEWANAIAAQVTRQCPGLERKRVVCRLHSYEAFVPELAQIAWERVHDLIFVAEHIREIALAREPEIARKVRRIHVVPNGVDLERFELAARPRGKELAFLGNLNFKKGPMLLLQAFAALAARDPGWRLHVAGSFQEPRYELYLRQFVEAQGLGSRVQLCGHVQDTAAWLADKDFVVCSSLLEGHPVGLLESMACGLKPLIHEFVGARALYPPEFLWRTVEQFVRRAEAPEFERSSYRGFVARRYTTRHQREQLLALLGRGEWREPPPRAAQTAAPEAGARPAAVEYYNAFRPRLEQDRVRQNPRQERIKQRLRELIAPRDSVLDLGCGVGISTAFIRSLGVRDLLGVDFAPELIQSAQREHPGIEFRVADVAQLDCGRSFDFIVLADVVEHVPAERYPALFEVLSRHSHPDTLVWMSIPDPDWIELMRAHRPEQLQIIDNAVRMRALLDLAERSGFRLVSFASFGIDVPFEYAEYLWARTENPARRAAWSRVLGVPL
jgi:glycosyltransferase involved in cell wall biosynthesis/SAM-dependent methyltransferase